MFSVPCLLCLNEENYYYYYFSLEAILKVFILFYLSAANIRLFTLQSTIEPNRYVANRSDTDLSSKCNKDLKHNYSSNHNYSNLKQLL